MLEPACTLRDVNLQHGHDLAVSIANKKDFDPAERLHIVMCNASTNPNVSDPQHTIILNIRKPKWRLKNDYIATFVDGVHRRLAAKQLHELRGHGWTKNPFTVMLVTCVDRKDQGQWDSWA